MRWGVGGPRRVACRFLSLSSQTRDQTQPTAGSKPQIPNHWTARELLKLKKTSGGSTRARALGFKAHRSGPPTRRGVASAGVGWGFMAESEEELKRLLMKVKVESEKVGLKLNIHPTYHLLLWLLC